MGLFSISKPPPSARPNIHGERERADKLAERLGIAIPGDISITFWMLPILEKLADRLDKLEEAAKK
jgi:hypothetical protein